jgi:hypothetical protein
MYDYSEYFLLTSTTMVDATNDTKKKNKKNNVGSWSKNGLLTT